MDARTACYSRLMYAALTVHREAGTLHELPGTAPAGGRRLWRVRIPCAKVYAYLLNRWVREGLQTIHHERSPSHV